MRVGVELIDADNERAIVPGHYAPPYFRSNKAMLVANVGDEIEVYGERWKVVWRLFTYERSEEEENETHSVAHLYCTQIRGRKPE